jgi:hypothetical protein
MTTFSDTLAEAAWTIANAGFTLASHTSPDGWDGLLSLNAVTLLNVEEPDLSARFRADHGEVTLLVWMHQSDLGHISVVQHADDDSRNADTVEAAYYASANPAQFGDFS